MGVDYGKLLVGFCAAVWIAGMLVFLAFTFRSFLRLKKQVAEAVVLYPAGKGQARVYESPQIDSPFLLGLLRPVIYLPAGMKEEERQHVLAHEYQHVPPQGLSYKPVCFLVGAASLVQSSVLAFFPFL